MVKYQLPIASKVNIQVFIVSGQSIKTLVTEEKPAGYYSVKWDGTNNLGTKVASGIYIYTIQAGSFFDVKKMLFLQ